MSKPRRTPVDKLLNYMWVRDQAVTPEEVELIKKIVGSLTKEHIEASAALPVPFVHALAHYADSPRALHILYVMLDVSPCALYFAHPGYKDKYGNNVLANLCSRAYFSTPDNPVRMLVKQLGGKPSPADPCTGVVSDYRTRTC
jgi:hypothetical protein